MRRVVFRDAENRNGCITEQLEVYYDGPWKATVEAYIEGVEAEYDTEADSFPTGDVYSRLVIELPEEAPIVEIKRAANSDACPPR